MTGTYSAQHSAAAALHAFPFLTGAVVAWSPMMHSWPATEILQSLHSFPL